MEQMECVSPEPTLKDYLQIIRRRKWVVLGSVVTMLAIGVLVTVFATPVFRADAQLLVREGAVRPSSHEVQNPAVDLLALEYPESVDTQLALLQSPAFVADVLQKVTGLPPEEQKRNGPAVAAERVKDSNVIDLTVDSPDPKLAARVANAILNEYLERDHESSLKEVRAAKSFVGKERQRAKLWLAKSERDLLKFRQRHRVAQLTTEQESRTKELVDLESHYRDDEAAMMRTAAQVNQVRAQLAREPAVKRVPVGRPNPHRAALASALAELETQRAALLAQYREHTPAVVAVNEQIQQLRQRLAAEPEEQVIPLTSPNPAYEEVRTRLKELERQLDGLQAERTQLSAQLASEHERMNQLGPWEVQLAQLTRASAAAEKSFLMLDEKLQDLAIRENAHVSPARIAQAAAIPIDPVFPRKTITLIIAAMMGMMVGLGVAFLQEHLDDGGRTPEEGPGVRGQGSGKLPELTPDPRPLAPGLLLRAAIPIDRVFPRKTITLIIAAMMGMMVGLGVAFLQEHRDDRLHTPEEVNRALGLPVPGCVPAVSASRAPTSPGTGPALRAAAPTACRSYYEED